MGRGVTVTKAPSSQRDKQAQLERQKARARTYAFAFGGSHVGLKNIARSAEQSMVTGGRRILDNYQAETGPLGQDPKRTGHKVMAEIERGESGQALRYHRTRLSDLVNEADKMEMLKTGKLPENNPRQGPLQGEHRILRGQGKQAHGESHSSPREAAPPIFFESH